MSQDRALELHDVTVAYDRKPVLYGIDLQVTEGKLVGIVGPNGAGKSSLIKTIMGFLQPSQGWVEIFGKEYQKNRHRVGYMPQREEIDWDFPVTVMDVVLMGCYGRVGLFKSVGRLEKKNAERCLEKVEMLAYANRQIANLSGGQQQRVFLARALMQQSDLYLMDEPFAGVDAATERTIVSLLQEIKKQGKTILVVHHDLHTAKQYFDQLLLLNMRVVAFGDTETVFTDELLQQTYGGRLTILSEVVEEVSKVS